MKLSTVRFSTIDQRCWHQQHLSTMPRQVTYVSAYPHRIPLTTIEELDRVNRYSPDPFLIHIASVPPHTIIGHDYAAPFKIERRTIPIPPHRVAACRSSWPKIYTPLVQNLQLQVRFNLKSKAVELRTSSKTTNEDAIQKGADFIQGLALGFDIEDAVALLRL